MDITGDGSQDLKQRGIVQDIKYLIVGVCGEQILLW